MDAAGREHGLDVSQRQQVEGPDRPDSRRHRASRGEVPQWTQQAMNMDWTFRKDSKSRSRIDRIAAVIAHHEEKSRNGRSKS